MQEFRFKDVELTFNFKKLPICDQDYLRTMTYEKIKERSVELANIIDEKYSDDKLYENFVNQVYGDKIVEDDEIDALFASLAEE